LEKQIKAELRTNPSSAKTNKPVELIITVRDREASIVRDFVLNHERLMHLLLVSDDLQNFDHLHPKQNPDGSFSVRHTFQHGGNYWLYADFVPSHKIGPSIERFDLWVEGKKPSHQKLKNQTYKTSKADGLMVTLEHDTPLHPNKELQLSMLVTEEQTGKPVKDLQPYLGALAHVVIISQDGSEFLHTHPLEHAMSDHGDHSHSKHTASHQETDYQIGTLTQFPNSGIYKMWVQLQRNNKVVTLPFVLNVNE
jgi:hypothetical protein